MEAGEQRTTAQAFEDLYLAHYDQMQGYVYALVHDAHVTADVCAEVYVRAAQSFPYLNLHAMDFTSWILGMAKACARDYYANTQPLVSLDSLPEDASLVMEDPNTWQTVNDYVDTLLDSLSRNERKIVRMRYFEQKRNVQIAHELGLNQSTVASRLQRALMKMRSNAKHNVS